MLVTMIAAPWVFASCVSMCAIFVALWSSRCEMGSSSRMKSNGWQSALMMATLCCCPNDIFRMGTSFLSVIPMMSKYLIMSCVCL